MINYENYRAFCGDSYEPREIWPEWINDPTQDIYLQNLVDEILRESGAYNLEFIPFLSLRDYIFEQEHRLALEILGDEYFK